MRPATREERLDGPPAQCRGCGRDGRDHCDATGDLVRVDGDWCDECAAWLDEGTAVPASARVRPSRWDSEEDAVSRFEGERDYAEWAHGEAGR